VIEVRASAQRFPVDEGRPVEHDRPIPLGDGRAQAADGLVVPHLEDLGFGSDLVPRCDWRNEAPVDVEEDAAGAGEVLGDEGVEEAGGDAALDDDAAEATRLGPARS